ncbi:phosphoglycolate phosphatase [Paraglaciecola sp.]|uniref:phosphoglycolate phosphatase n=1 Tax=Paraglaciecola sp. TaxID=1920173 RepID=UPI003EF2C107
MQFLTLTNQNIRPKAILFDLDGTLIDSAPDLAAAVNAMLTHFSLPTVSLAQVSTWIGNGAAKLVERVFKYTQNNQNQLHNIPTQQQGLTQFFVEYEKVQGLHSTLYPNVKHTLTELSKLGVTMALITNKPGQFTPNVLAEHGIDSFFDLVLSGDSLTEKKPHPMPILHTLKTLGLSKKQTIMVGDSASDIQASNSAGVTSICVTYGYNHGDNPLNLNASAHIDEFNQLLG